MSNILHAEMLRQFAARLSRPARDLIAIASLMQIARRRGGPLLAEAHWRSLQVRAAHLGAILREWAILGITLDQLPFWEDAPPKAALVRAAERWGTLPRRSGTTAEEQEEAARCLRTAALSV